MNLNPWPRSHVQLIVPVQYQSLCAGAPVNSNRIAAFDGDIETTFNASGAANSDVQYVFAWAAALPYYCLIQGHQGNDSGYNIQFGGVAQTIQDKIETDIGSSVQNFVASGTSLTRNGASSAYCDCLLEFAPAARTSNLKLYINTPGSGSTARGVIFSDNFRVPVFDRGWETDYSGDAHGSELTSLSGQKNPSFNIAGYLRQTAVHTFRWSGLIESERLAFSEFLRAFGGNIERPFAMCIVHGVNPHSFKEMDVMWMVISEPTIKWEKGDDGRHAISFTATEFIRFDVW